MIKLLKRLIGAPVSTGLEWCEHHKFDWHAKERQEREKKAERDYKEARGRV